MRFLLPSFWTSPGGYATVGEGYQQAGAAGNIVTSTYLTVRGEAYWIKRRQYRSIQAVFRYPSRNHCLIAYQSTHHAEAAYRPC